MKKLLAILALFAGYGFAQTIPYILYYNTDPTGACPARRIVVSIASGNPFYCNASTGNWSAFTGGLSTPVSVANGGTSLATLTAHALYAGNGTSAPTAVGPDASTTKALFAAGASADPAYRAIAAADLPTAIRNLSCQPGLGDGANAIAAATYLQTNCYNDTGATITLSTIRCYTDNSGTSSLAATNGAGTALLTGAVTCTTAYAAGTQSATVTIASGDFIKFTFIADGTSKQTAWVVTAAR